jgi:2-aminoadipate transaminase
MKPAHRFQHIADPTVLELLKLTETPDIISFSGGTPSPKTFVTSLIKSANREIKPNLQYSPSAGITPLRRTIADWLTSKWQVKLTEDNILITTGSQQALDLVARTYINQNDTILLEDPTYFVALYAFGAYQPQYHPINLHHLTPPPKSAKLLYLVSNFQNPTGYTVSLSTRNQLISYAQKNQLLILEDDPYGELYFKSPPPPTIASLSLKHTVYCTSLSKTLGPAFRIGVIISSSKIIQSLTRVKQGMDLCTSGYLQQLANYVILHQQFQPHLEKTRHYYHHQYQLMAAALTKYMPPEVTWTQPQGGLFIWMTLPDHQDPKKLFQHALKKKVAFVPGYIFSPTKSNSPHLRLTYAIATPEQIDQGIHILSQIIKTFL